MPKEEKSVFHLQLNPIQKKKKKKKKPTGDLKRHKFNFFNSFPAFSLLLSFQILYSESPARHMME